MWISLLSHQMLPAEPQCVCVLESCERDLPSRVLLPLWPTRSIFSLAGVFGAWRGPHLTPLFRAVPTWVKVILSPHEHLSSWQLHTATQICFHAVEYPTNTLWRTPYRVCPVKMKCVAVRLLFFFNIGEKKRGQHKWITCVFYNTNVQR